MGANGSRTACVLHSSAEIGDFGDGLSRIAHSQAGEVDWITAESCSGYAGFLTTDPFLSEKNIAANGPKTMEVWHNRAEICNFGDGSLRVVHFLPGTADRITAEFRSGYAGFLSTDSVLSKRKAEGNGPRTMEVWHSSAEIRNFGDGLSPMVHSLAGEVDRITTEFRNGYAGIPATESYRGPQEPCAGPTQQGGGGGGEERAAKGEPKEAATGAAAAGAAAARRAAGPRGGAAEGPSRKGGDGDPDGPPGRGGGSSRGMV
jgi:hypothetical protein